MYVHVSGAITRRCSWVTCGDISRHTTYRSGLRVVTVTTRLTLSVISRYIRLVDIQRRPRATSRRRWWHSGTADCSAASVITASAMRLISSVMPGWDMASSAVSRQSPALPAPLLPLPLRCCSQQHLRLPSAALLRCVSWHGFFSLVLAVHVVIPDTDRGGGTMRRLPFVRVCVQDNWKSFEAVGGWILMKF